MSIVVLIFVAVLAMIVIGALLGKIAWDRAVVLLLVTAVVAAAWYYLSGAPPL